MENRGFLPSKGYIIRLGIIIGVVLLVFVIVHFWPKKNNNGPKHALPDTEIIVDQSIKVSDVLNKDSNTNGVPDWEEVLWGLDPGTDGAKNKTFIENKKKNLAESSQSSTDNGSSTINETDQFAKEFFSTFMSLQQSGNLNTNAIKNIAAEYADKIAGTELPDVYTRKDIKITTENKLTLQTYKDNMERIIGNHDVGGIGSELDILANAIGNEDAGSASDLATIADEYTKFAKDLVKVSVPKSISDAHLRLANTYADIGTSVKYMSQVLDNPVVGMTGTALYQRYSNYSDSIVEEIKAVFIKNGILNSDA